MNDVDTSSKLSRDQMEGLISHVLVRIQGPVHRAMADSGLTLEQTDGIELVGGRTRVPAIRKRIQDALPSKALSTTLNQDEAIARGAIFALTLCFSLFYVSATSTYDRYQPKSNGLYLPPILAMIQSFSFSLKATLSLLPKCCRSTVRSHSTLRQFLHTLTYFCVLSILGLETLPLAILRVNLRTRLNLHGLTSFEGAYVEEIGEEEEPACMDVDGSADATAPAPAPKKRVMKKRRYVPIVSTNSSLDRSIVVLSRTGVIDACC